MFEPKIRTETTQKKNEWFIRSLKQFTQLSGLFGQQSSNHDGRYGKGAARYAVIFCLVNFLENEPREDNTLGYFEIHPLRPFTVPFYYRTVLIILPYDDAQFWV